MSGWDVYCAICGGPLDALYWEPIDYGRKNEPNYDARASYDPELLVNPEDPELGWLLDFRLVGELEEHDEQGRAPGPWGIWVSGRTFYYDYGTMNFQPNEPGRNPTSAMQRIQAIYWDVINVYSWDNREYPWVAPFHVCCRDILCKYIGIPASQLNYEVFFDALKGLAQRERNGRSLDLDYGEIKVSMRQRWKLSDEYFLFNPVQVKGLEDVFKSLPALNLGDIKTFYGTTGDSFVRLPSEVLLMVLSHIEDIGVVYELRKASPVFANMELDNNWWKRRIRQNMPWLWDLPIQQSDIDWRKAYQRVYWGSRPTSRKAIKIQGLCNRRRIWEQMCPYFSQEYLKKETRFKKVGFVGSPVINGIYARMMENLAAVKPSENILKTTESLLHNFDDLPCAKPSLVVEWSEDGFLVDLRILKARENETRMGDLGIKVTSTSIVELPKDDWLTGFIITSREFEPEEMKDGGFFTPSQVVGLNIVFVRSPAIKLGSDFGKISSISVKDGFFVVGLQVNRVAQGTVRGIGLFEQPLAKANGCSRVA